MAKTFFGLLGLADLSTKGTPAAPAEEGADDKAQRDGRGVPSPILHQAPGLHYNIQIHLPATKDVEVYNAIFKSLRDHLYE
jgi:hypothetical protein